MATIGPDWVSASRTRNYCEKDPILDWLSRFGEEQGFVPDHRRPGYDERTDFSKFILAKGQAFEEAVMAYLATRVPDVVRIAGEYTDVASSDKATETWKAVREGHPLIAQAVLHDPVRQTYGAADLLVRSDVLADLFPESFSLEDAHVGAPEVPGGWHYRVVDIKFSTLHLRASGHADNRHLAYMAQLHIYNAALGRLQGYEPPCSFLLGRGWEDHKGERGANCMERLGPVEQAYVFRKNRLLADIVDDAVAWVRKMQRDGHLWSPLSHDAVPELRPNMGNQNDSPWHRAKREIADETGELTLLWHVGPDKRDATIAAGIRRWDDPACSAQAVGVTGAKLAPILDTFLEMNRPGQSRVLSADRVKAGRDVWGAEPPLEFFVDFETVSNLDDDFSRVPDQNGTPLITMVGCGHWERREWRFAQFAVDQLSERAEAEIIDAWLAHMADTAAMLWPGGSPVVYHWSHAETSTLDNAYNAARTRHTERDWPDVNWYDLLKDAVKKEPLVIRGAFGFGLKAVAKAAHSHALIATTWTDSSVDGLGAMVGTWWAAGEARRQGTDMNATDLIAEIGAYNEVDCRVMAELLAYLRGL